MTDDAGADTGGVQAAGREPWQPAAIEAIDRLTSRVVRVTLRPQRWRPFLPGQHIDVRLTAEDGYQAQRSYSVASPPSQTGTLELVIERLDDGEVSPFFHEFAAPGDTLEVRGPFAEHFVWRPDSPGAVFLAAGGSGVAPFLSMVRERAQLASPPPMALLYSARTWEETIARDELLQLEQEQRGLAVIFCLTREQARRPVDFSRRVDRAIIDHALARLGEPPRQSFVCGATRFVGTVADLLVEAGVPAESIRTERYGGA